ncbi:phosphoribosyltransferase [Patescibacteria group bacterium]|nr:phosphoribosyltransferase [Patescibacteria group bacterium]
MTTDQKRVLLKQLFLQNAFVKDADKGYVVAESFNLAIDPDILELASRCWADIYQHRKDIEAVVGLPDAGTRLAPLLAEKIHAHAILPSKRVPHPPGAWKDVVSYSNTSFTTNKDEVVSHIGFVRSGMKVLLVDDVVAHGNTAVAAIQALQQANVDVVGLAVLFDKAWQDGIKRIEQETKVKVSSLISLEKITPTGDLVLL